MQTDALDNILQKDKNNNDQGDNYEQSVEIMIIIISFIITIN